MIAEREEVKLQRLAFYAKLVRNVPNLQMAEVGLSRDRAQGSEFGAVERDPVITIGVRISEDFKTSLGRRIRVIRNALSEQCQAIRSSGSLLRLG